ncbi:RNA-guided endonuclease InsQ/TnpB family protein [Bacillus sp. JJ1562]|uniref:RNA-guided endonuclease InsQ/TnpB family protein n=1 Tax=Bacillus sp. JJ1562 TaxID=3122960 RepID=UPI0030010743
MLLNYKFEIYPTEDQKVTFERWISICRMQYNSALLDKQRIYKKENRNYKRPDMQKQQTLDKKVTPLLKEVPSQPLQEVFFRLEKAFEKFFRKEAKYPKLKKHKDYNSITFTQFGMARQASKNPKTGKVKRQLVRRAASLGKGGKLQISNLGLIDINFHRKLDGKVKQVIIKRQGNRWFAIFSVERHVNQTVLSGALKTTGIDLGIKKFAVLSDGTEIENPSFLRKKEKQLKRAQRKLSNKKKGSSNWKKQCAKVNKVHSKVANQRKDFLHKQSYNISNTYGIVCVEDLKIKNMIKNRHLSKSIHDAGWGMFRSFLSYKCERNGGLLVKVKPQYTSQNCSGCENVVKKSLSVRTHVCPKCGLVLDRDHNAAINIESTGLAQIKYNVA